MRGEHGEIARHGLLAAMSQAGDELISVLDELREISRGVHPAILSEGGLGPALRSLAPLGGKLTMRSPPGGGTALVIELPVEPGYGSVATTARP